MDVGRRVDVATLLEVHRRLLAPTKLNAHAGRVREVQNWIGGSSYNPCSADFVPPPPELVMPLLRDLCAFANSDDLPAVVQAALVHAQFETIHPFVDGNGRVGRTLIQMVLRRRGLARRVVPPVSLILGTLSKEYVGALNATRYRGRPTSVAARDGLGRLVGFFATACRRAVADALAFESHVADIQTEWRRLANPVRKNSATDLLILRLPGAPIVTVKTAALLIGRTEQATNEAIARLTAAGILSQLNVGRRNRAFECATIIDAFTEFERRLASPPANTRVMRPARPVVRSPPAGS